ncbi:unnamed protein product, partial [marine sediment metagenome]
REGELQESPANVSLVYQVHGSRVQEMPFLRKHESGGDQLSKIIIYDVPYRESQMVTLIHDSRYPYVPPHPEFHNDFLIRLSDEGYEVFMITPLGERRGNRWYWRKKDEPQD